MAHSATIRKASITCTWKPIIEVTESSPRSNEMARLLYRGTKVAEAAILELHSAGRVDYLQEDEQELLDK
jgi:hypothetical protein